MLMTLKISCIYVGPLLTAVYFENVTVFFKVAREEIMLQYDNTSSHTAEGTLQNLDKNKITVIEHLSYSPDLIVCNFCCTVAICEHNFS